MIQDRLKDFREIIEKELGKSSLSAKTDWLETLKGNSCSAKHIREMYLIWLHLIAEEMEKNPRFECANTMECFVSLNCHNVDIDEIYQMACDCISFEGLFKRSPNKYEQEANEKIIARPKQGLRDFNKFLYNMGKLIGFPWNFCYEGYGFREIAGMIKNLCVDYLKRQTVEDKGACLAKLKVLINRSNAVLALPKGLNPQIHKDWFGRNYSESTARQYRDWLDVVKHPELLPLLNWHGIGPDIYSCTNLVQLTKMFEELVENQTSRAQQANQHPNMVSAVRCYIAHLLEINGLL